MMYKIWLLSFIFTINLQAKHIVQLKDFLCGVDTYQQLTILYVYDKQSRILANMLD